MRTTVSQFAPPPNFVHTYTSTKCRWQCIGGPTRADDQRSMKEAQQRHTTSETPKFVHTGGAAAARTGGTVGAHARDTVSARAKGPTAAHERGAADAHTGGGAHYPYSQETRPLCMKEAQQVHTKEAQPMHTYETAHILCTRRRRSRCTN